MWTPSCRRVGLYDCKLLLWFKVNICLGIAKYLNFLQIMVAQAAVASVYMIDCKLWVQSEHFCFNTKMFMNLFCFTYLQIKNEFKILVQKTLNGMRSNSKNILL